MGPLLHEGPLVPEGGPAAASLRSPSLCRTGSPSLTALLLLGLAVQVMTTVEEFKGSAAEAGAAGSSGRDQEAALKQAAASLSADKRKLLAERLLEQELAILNKLLDGRALQSHMEGNYLQALTLALSSSGTLPRR